MLPNAGSGVVKHSCSVAELLDRWLSHEQGNLTRATYEEYRRTVERDLKRALTVRNPTAKASPLAANNHTLTVEQSLTRLNGETTVGGTSDGSLPYKPDGLGQAYRRVAKRAGIFMPAPWSSATGS